MFNCAPQEGLPPSGKRDMSGQTTVGTSPTAVADFPPLPPTPAQPRQRHTNLEKVPRKISKGPDSQETTTMTRRTGDTRYNERTRLGRIRGEIIFSSAAVITSWATVLKSTKVLHSAQSNGKNKRPLQQVGLNLPPRRFCFRQLV